MLHGVDKLHRTSAILKRQTVTAYCCRRNYVANASNGPSIAVLGGGITGLATAYYITKRIPRAKVTLFDASDRIGGWLSSSRIPVSGGSILFESGPRSLRPAGNGILTLQMLDDLKLEDDTILTPTSSPAANHRYLYYPDRFVRMPHPSFGLLNVAATVLQEPIFKGVLLGAVKEPFVKVRPAELQDESVGDFFSRRMSRPLVDNLLSAVLHGIYAGDVYKLSARTLFARLWREEQESQSILLGVARSSVEGVITTRRDLNFLKEINQVQDTQFVTKLRRSSVFTFKDGINALVDRLTRRLWDNNNTEVRISTKVSSVRLSQDGTGVDVSIAGEDGLQRFDHAISALSPAHLNALLPSPVDRVPDIPAVTVMTVNLFFKKRQFLPPGPGADALGFGYLIPRATPFEQNPERALGVVFDHAYALPRIKSIPDDDARVTQDVLDEAGTKVTVMLGGHWWDDWPAYPDEQEGLKMARAVLERHLCIKDEPEAYQVNLQRDCIPQFTVGHEDRLKTAHQNLQRAYKGRLRVAGSWVAGVGVNDCLRSAYDVVRRLEDGKDGTGLEHVGAEELIRMQISPVRR